MDNRLDLPPPALTYDPEDLAGGPLITDVLVDWMRACGRKAMAWVLSGSPEGYTRQAALADHEEWLEQQEFLTLISHLNETELRLLLDGVKRGQSGEVPLEVAIEECRQAMDAYRANRAMQAAA